MAEEQAIPQDALDAAEAADTKCQRENCQRMDCNGFLCVKALEAVYAAAELRGRTEQREADARIAEDEDGHFSVWGEDRNTAVAQQTCRDIAAAIRNQGQPT